MKTCIKSASRNLHSAVVCAFTLIELLVSGMHCKYLPGQNPLPRIMIVLALTAIQSLAQSTYEAYTFTTLAGIASNASYGSADGTGSAARFTLPSGVAVDSAGNLNVAA